VRRPAFYLLIAFPLGMGLASLLFARDIMVNAPTPTPIPLPLPVVVVSGMSDPVKIAVIGSLSAALTSMLGVAVSLFNGRRLRAVEQKAVEIHTLTNGNLHQVEAGNKVLTEKVESLQAQLAAALLSGKLAAGVAAQAATDVRTASATPTKERP
jgi:hypothetical protein